MKRSISTLLLVACGLTAEAQRQAPASPRQPVRATRTDTTIKGTTLEVYQVYQPELKPMVKPEVSPSLPPPQKDPVPQQYEVPQQTLYYSYRSLPLRPLALGKDSGSVHPQNYLLLGGGNLSTILAEAGIGSLKGRNWTSALQSRYITQEGRLQGQIYRSLMLHGSGSYQGEAHVFEADLNAYRNVFGRYGYNHDINSYGFDDIRMVYNAASVTLGARNTRTGIWDVTYHPQLTIGTFDATSGHESTVAVYLPVTKPIDSALSLELALNGQLAWTTINGSTQSTSVLQLAPAVNFHKDGLNLHAGLSPTFSQAPTVELLPDIAATYRMLNNRLSITAGWQLQRVQNTLEQITKVNPYVTADSLYRRQGARNNLFGGADLALGKHLSFWGRIGRERHTDMPVYFTQRGGDGKDFVTSYSSFSALTWGGGLRYAIGEDFNIGAEAHWYDFYSIDGYSRVYGEPGVRMKGDASWRVLDGLLISAYGEVQDRIWARNALGEDVLLRGVFDIGAAAEYTFVDRLSLFIRTENLLNRRNERWLGYPSYGFNIYGGLRFRF